MSLITRLVGQGMSLTHQKEVEKLDFVTLTCWKTKNSKKPKPIMTMSLTLIEPMVSQQSKGNGHSDSINGQPAK